MGICEDLARLGKFPVIVDPRLIPLHKRIITRLIGYCKLCRVKPSGFKGEVDLYVVFCRKHRVYFVDYPHGYSQYFICPFCSSEEKFKEKIRSLGIKREELEIEVVE